VNAHYDDKKCDGFAQTFFCGLRYFVFIGQPGGWDGKYKYYVQTTVRSGYSYARRSHV